MLISTDDPTLDLTDADWTERVSIRLLELDRSLTGPEVYGMAVALAARPRWRALEPEAAAEKAHVEPEAVAGA